MSYDTLTATVPYAFGKGQEILFSYPSGRTADDYRSEGAILSVGSDNLRQGAESFFVTYGSSSIRVFYNGPQQSSGSVTLKAPLSVEAGVISGSPVGAYLGQIATRCFIPQGFNGTNKQIMTRTVHRMRDAVSSFQVGWANWYASGTSGELVPAADMTIRASIEYPIGTTPQRLYFSGSDTGTIRAGANLFCDTVSLSIPLGAQFAIKAYCTSTAGVIFINQGQSGVGDGASFGPSGVTDNTGTTTNPGATANTYPPLAIIGLTSKPSVFIAGDSISCGTGDTTNDNGGDTGLIARSIGTFMPYLHAGTPSERALDGATSSKYTRRLALSAYCSHVICNYGRNDIANRTSDQILADLKTFFALFPGKPVFQTTITPLSTSTDSWATTANQTADTNNSKRTAVNAEIRAGMEGCSGVFDVADVVETARDSSIWLAGGTADGLHPNANLYTTIRNSRVINPGVIRR